MHSTKYKEIKEALQSDESATPSLLALKDFKAEKDTDETDLTYETKTRRDVLNTNSVNENIDFNIPLTDTSIGVTEFQTSNFTIWINFRLFLMSIGESKGIPCEEDGIPTWIHHFGVDLANLNTLTSVSKKHINLSISSTSTNSVYSSTFFFY
jgi:hypothetical protein